MQEALLDTDILSEVLRRKNANVVSHASEYLQEHGTFTFSSITWYEILRGLKYKDAKKQRKNFDVFYANSIVLPITNAILERASDLWVQGESEGHPHRDADLIIGATAMENGLSLVTGNTVHFSWMPGLTVENWREE